MLSNAYFLAKFRFDTAENEPAKNLQKIEKIANFTISTRRSSARRGVLGVRRSPRLRDRDRHRREGMGLELRADSLALRGSSLRTRLNNIE